MPIFYFEKFLIMADVSRMRRFERKQKYFSKSYQNICFSKQLTGCYTKWKNVTWNVVNMVFFRSKQKGFYPILYFKTISWVSYDESYLWCNIFYKRKEKVSWKCSNGVKCSMGINKKKGQVHLEKYTSVTKLTDTYCVNCWLKLSFYYSITSSNQHATCILSITLSIIIIFDEEYRYTSICG